MGEARETAFRTAALFRRASGLAGVGIRDNRTGKGAGSDGNEESEKDPGRQGGQH